MFKSVVRHAQCAGVEILLIFADLDVREKYKDYVYYGGLPSKAALAYMHRAYVLSLHPDARFPGHEVARQLWGDLEHAVSFIEGDIRHDGREEYSYAASKLYTAATKIVSSLADEDAGLLQLAWDYHSQAQQAAYESRDYKRAAELRSLPFARAA